MVGPLRASSNPPGLRIEVQACADAKSEVIERIMQTPEPTIPDCRAATTGQADPSFEYQAARPCRFSQLAQRFCAGDPRGLLPSKSVMTQLASTPAACPEFTPWEVAQATTGWAESRVPEAQTWKAPQGP